ncbi:response regulator [Pseudoalteromonas denitrificans]|uniref:Two-component system, chemotaxis family, response regulator CheY n=1 Tax=Pseudoalteromonas denitrificans DSM 6059 TaxID=1123010 RepID=A0A1I1FLJ3_9GAMM|nr:response regulator [Pseudoalteromonas denitrificans]SFC00389.1 two-component system, chemotaxis family, response regulator CheY [Pseudoalteromonas denitrificans DSM 6059]
MKILIVDDMTSMRHVLMHMLRDIGHSDCDEATDGLQALSLLYKKQYDLLITDLHMPNLDGKQLLEKIRAETEFSKLPVLMISSEDERAKVKEIIAAKVTGFIVKPFNYNTLQKQILRIDKCTA